MLGATVDTTYEYGSLEQKVASLPQTSLVSVTDSDIASMAAEPASASRIELRLTGEAASLHTASLEQALLHPFRLSCGGKNLFVGVVYQLEGAAALRTPVLHVGRDAENRLVLRLGAWQGAWLGLTSSGDAAAKSRIDRAEFRAPFCRRGVLSELASGRR